MKKIILIALMFITFQVNAHVSIYPKVGVVDKYALLTINVPHSCYGSPTKSITVTSPIVGLKMHPAQKSNWTISTIERDLPVALYDKNEFGEYYSKEINQVTWTGTLPEGLSEQFMISIKTPAEPQIIEFDVVQVCEDGRIFNFTKNSKNATKEIMYERPVKFEVK